MYLVLVSLPPSSDWVVNQHRDSLASYIGHHNLTEFFAVAENESKARIKFNCLQVCVCVCVCVWAGGVSVRWQGMSLTLSTLLVFCPCRRCCSLVECPLRNLRMIELSFRTHANIVFSFLVCSNFNSHLSSFPKFISCAIYTRCVV